MQRLQNAIEQLEDKINVLEAKIVLDRTQRQENLQKQAEMIRLSQTREANALAVAKTVAARLEQTIGRVETVLRG